MRRAARVFFHAAAGVSGVLFLLAVGGLGVSYGRAYDVGRYQGGHGWDVAISRGALGVEWDSNEPAPVRAHWSGEKVSPFDLRASTEQLFPLRRVSFAGFGFGQRTLPGATVTNLVFPIPFLVILLALLPLAELIRFRRHRRGRYRAAAVLCARCGYDLRASPGRCPECGAIPAAVSSV